MKLNTLILKEFLKRERLVSSDLVDKFGITRQAVNRHLKSLVLAGQILKLGSSKRGAYYVLNRASSKKKIFGLVRTYHKRIRPKGLQEDVLLSEIEAQADLLGGLSSQARTIFGYAFTEMVNNAIDHSKTTYIDIDVSVNRAIASFSVNDAGIGIFENICEKKGLESEMDAIEDVLKGKTTTAPKEHSGEGIFFTSKAADKFIIESHRKKLVVDNRIEDVFIDDIRFKQGTKVTFEIGIDSKKDLTGIFREFTNEEFGFDKTRVTVRLYESGGSYVSRSQAKRLVHSLENFGEIILDFAGVATIGQGFADEIFRIFKQAHPGIRITAMNANENVGFMIKRAS